MDADGVSGGNGLVNAAVKRVERTREAARCEDQTGTPVRTARGHLAWVVAFALVGFLVPAVFVGGLQLPRAWYLIVYFAAVGGVGYGYIRWSGVDVRRLVREHWVTGLAVGAAVSVFTVNTVLMQPSSAAPQGPDLVFNLGWLGIAYGIVDGLFLSVFPVYATWKALGLRGWTDRWGGRIAASALAILASMFVILVYHLGYPECRGPQVGQIVVGVALQSVAYLIARSPIAPVLSHTAMHIAAVLYGLNSVSQLPPHY